MIKEELIKVFEEGLKLNRINKEQYNTALDLYNIIYEEKAVSESSEAHAQLCKLINLASDYDPKRMRTLVPDTVKKMLQNITKELRR